MEDSLIEVLFVDDEEVIRQLAKRQLVEDNLLVTVVENGEKAIRYVREKKPCVVFLDINLPGRNGLDILQDIKAVSPHVPVVMISGRISPEQATLAHKRGAAAYLCKPFNWSYVRKVACIYSYGRA